MSTNSMSLSKIKIIKEELIIIKISLKYGLLVISKSSINPTKKKSRREMEIPRRGVACHDFRSLKTCLKVAPGPKSPGPKIVIFCSILDLFPYVQSVFLQNNQHV